MDKLIILLVINQNEQSVVSYILLISPYQDTHRMLLLLYDLLVKKVSNNDFLHNNIYNYIFFL